MTVPLGAVHKIRKSDFLDRPATLRPASKGNAVAAIDFAEKMLDHIRLRGPSNAGRIADTLGVDRTVVSSAPYRPLRGKVRQGRDYTWSLAEAPEMGRDPGRAPKNSREDLFAYYLDCLSQDADSGVRTVADSKFELDYVVRGSAANRD
jgi:hypothetical protein